MVLLKVVVYVLVMGMAVWAGGLLVLVVVLEVVVRLVVVVQLMPQRGHQWHEVQFAVWRDLLLYVVGEEGR